MDWTYNSYEDKIKERLRKVREQMEYEEEMRKAEEWKRKQDEKRQQKASIDPMAELAKLATSTHAVNEDVYFDNGWKVFIGRKEGEKFFYVNHISPGIYGTVTFTGASLTPVQVVREMVKVSQR